MLWTVTGWELLIQSSDPIHCAWVPWAKPLNHQKPTLPSWKHRLLFFYARVLPGHVFPQAAKFQYPCLAGLQFLARISPSLVNILESFSLSTKMFILRSKRDWLNTFKNNLYLSHQTTLTFNMKGILPPPPSNITEPTGDTIWNSSEVMWFSEWL